MTIADTSVWVEFLRRRRSPAALRLARLVAAQEVAIVEPVAMELLAGARSRTEEHAIRRLIAGVRPILVGGLDAWEDAALIYRACRRSGAIVRSQLDCLIAAVAIREDVPVLHADRDFDLIAMHTPLRVLGAD